jgi:hypothetical protein
MRSRLIVPAALCAIVLAAYLMPLVGGATFVQRDHLTHTLPAKQYLADALRAGHLPEWWDGAYLGVPFAANPNHSVLYPPSWIVAALPMPWGADVLLIAHVLFAGLGMAALARRFGAGREGQIVAGTALMLSGFVTSSLVQGGPLLTLAWTPWSAIAADRVAASTNGGDRARAGLVLAAVQGAQLLAGDPSFVIIGGLVALAVALARSERRLATLATLAGSALGAVVLAAVVILPAFALAGETARSDLSTAAAQTWSLHPLRVLEWLFPDALGDPNVPRTHLATAIANASGGIPGLGPSWALSVYIGLPTLVFAALGWRVQRERRWYAVAGAVFLVLALGKYTPVHAFYRAVFLPERLVRYPEKYLFGALVIACAVAGRGVTDLLASRPARRLLLVLACVVAGYALVIAIAALAGGALIPVATPGVDAEHAVAYAVHVSFGAVVAIALIVVGCALAYRADARRSGLVLVSVAFCGHLVARTWQVLVLMDRETIEEPPALLANMHSGTSAGIRTRIFRPPQLAVEVQGDFRHHVRELYDTAMQNTPTRFGFADVPGYDQAHDRRIERVWAVASRRMALAAYGIELAIVPHQLARAEGMTPLALDDSGIVLARTEAPRPRAFVTSRWQWFSAEQALLAALFAQRSGPPDPATLASVRLQGIGTDGAGEPQTEPCRTTSERAERVSLHCKSASEGYAVLLDAYAPGWTATVDGQPARIELADGLVRAVHVAAGVHVIDFTYRAPGLRTGALVSLLAWCGLVAALIVLRRKST